MASVAAAAELHPASSPSAPRLKNDQQRKKGRSSKQRNKAPTTSLLPDSPLLSTFSKHVYTALISTILLTDWLHFFVGSIPHRFAPGKASHLLIRAALQSVALIPVHFVCAVLQLVEPWHHLLSKMTLKWEDKMKKKKKKKKFELLQCWKAYFRYTSEALSNPTSASKGLGDLLGDLFAFRSCNHSKFPHSKSCNALVCQIVLLIYYYFICQSENTLQRKSSSLSSFILYCFLLITSFS